MLRALAIAACLIATPVAAQQTAVCVPDAAAAALFLSWDVDGNKSGILYDWPELG